jgi:hypothetical protein
MAYDTYGAMSNRKIYAQAQAYALACAARPITRFLLFPLQESVVAADAINKDTRL